jgi:hypothetical protein
MHRPTAETPTCPRRPRAAPWGRRWVLRLAGLGALATAIAAVAAVHAKEPQKDDRAVVTMAGLRVHRDGSSTLYVELTRPVPVDVEAGHNGIVFKLREAKVPFRNNRNPLLSQHLSSVVKSARLVSRERDVALEVELRKPAKPRHELVSRPGGAATLEIEFPPAGG